MSILLLSCILMVTGKYTMCFECLFDEILPANVAVQNVNYRIQAKTSERTTKRSLRNSGSSFKAIRVFVHYSSGFSEFKESAHIQQFYNFVKSAVKIVSSYLSVIPVEGNLLLKRTLACYTYWNDGINKNRCSRLRLGYKGEYCMNQFSNFKIPDDHLEGIALFNYSDITPTNKSIPSGNGVAADYILYLEMIHSERCNENGIIAYAYYCQQDQNGRPIAGYINFCPNVLHNSVFSNKKAIPIILHELFHALGYSIKLFDKFRPCFDDDSDEQCGSRKRIIVQDRNGIFRLLLPSVIREMKRHSKCNLDDFGGPLEPQKEEIQSPSSHWDPRIMYGSIMASQLRENEFIFIDRITLAVFEDSGWYQVNYSLADYYPWGKDQGCDFGLTSSCINMISSPQFFCNPLLLSEVCDYAHYGKSNCSEETTIAPCHINKPYKTELCDITSISNDDVSDIHEFQESRCFLLYRNNESLPICLKHRCSIDSNLEIFWNNSWIHCPYNSLISVDKNNDTLIKCPLEGILCKIGKWRYLAEEKQGISGCSSIFCFMYINLYLLLCQIMIMLLKDTSKQAT